MTTTQARFSLKSLNSFHFDVYASSYVQLKSAEETLHWIKTQMERHKRMLILGGGSNLLFDGDYDGTVVQAVMDGIQLVKENDREVFLEVGAGRNWDDFVSYCVAHQFYGIENLSLIPGHVGASPVQNIGAYGVEVKDVVHQVKGFYLKNGEAFSYNNQFCEFGYRDSIFKRHLKNKVIITSVVFKLSKAKVFQLSYGQVREAVEKKGELSLSNVRNTIIDIRNSKLPDPEVIGNAGSFFKNPVITRARYLDLQISYPEIPGYIHSEEAVKIPAGWLIDRAGWKGRKMGQAGVHSEQALVLVNLGQATGSDVLHLAQHIEKDIKTKFDILLEKEVNVVGS